MVDTTPINKPLFNRKFYNALKLMNSMDFSALLYNVYMNTKIAYRFNRNVYYSCECSTQLDKDHSAAINISRLGRSLQETRS